MFIEAAKHLHSSLIRLFPDRVVGAGISLWRQTLCPELARALRQDQATIRIMRFAVGVTLAVVLAFTIQWSLSFLTPVLTAVILALPLPAPSLRTGSANMIQTCVAFLIGVVFTLFLLPYPLVYIPMLGLALFHIYYFLNRGGSFWFALMTLLAILIMPILGIKHEGLAFGFAFGFIWSGWITVLMIWLAHMIFPDPSFTLHHGSSRFQPGYNAQAAENALKSTVVVLPLASLFIAYNWAGQLLVMVFAAIFTLSPDLAKGKEAGINSLKSTLIGGVAAWFFYWAIVAVPELYFFVVLMFLAALFFATQIFSGKPSAGYYSSAFVALFILVNSSLDASKEFSSVFFLRVLYIWLAVIYVVVVLRLLETYWPESVKSGQ